MYLNNKKIATFVTLLISICIVCISCKQHAEKTKNMDNNKNEYQYDDSQDLNFIMIFKDKKYENYSDLEKIFKVGSDSTFFDQILYDKPAIRIEYYYDFKINSEIYSTGQFELKADNNKDFTAKELMFKIHNEVFQYYIKNEDNIIEGLTFIETQEDGVDLFELAVGN